MKMQELLSSRLRSVAFYPDLVPFIGSINAVLLLCQLSYWTDKQKDPDGWIYKTRADLEKETGLNKHQQKIARLQLKKIGAVEEKRKGIPPIVHFRIKKDFINNEWKNYLIEKSLPASVIEENISLPKQVLENKYLSISRPYIPESTPETTQKITSSLDRVREEVYATIGRPRLIKSLEVINANQVENGSP